MGCDIHLYVEAKGGPSGRWTPLNRSVTLDGGHRVTETYDLGWGDTRNYDAFAMLADVRNGYGFAGVDTGDGFVPIAPPKGIPDDASSEYRDAVDGYGRDGHSHSWFTLRELLDLEETGYWDKTTIRRGVIMKDTLEQAKADGIVSSIEGQTAWLTDWPSTMAGAISGPNIGPKDLWECRIKKTYRECAGWLTRITIPAMTEVADSYVLNGFFTEPMEPLENGRKPYPTVITDPTKAMPHWRDAAELVRMVFFFDN